MKRIPIAVGTITAVLTIAACSGGTSVSPSPIPTDIPINAPMAQCAHEHTNAQMDHWDIAEATLVAAGIRFDVVDRCGFRIKKVDQPWGAKGTVYGTFVPYTPASGVDPQLRYVDWLAFEHEVRHAVLWKSGHPKWGDIGHTWCPAPIPCDSAQE